MPLRDMIANANSGGTLYAIPSGVIMMWSGSIATIPSGFALCNGSNGTPDLRDRFIVAAGNSYNPGATGGESSHQLTTAEMPGHYHNGQYSMSLNGGGSTPYHIGYAMDGDGAQWFRTAAVGGDGYHENRPPYYALAYIMKT